MRIASSGSQNKKKTAQLKPFRKKKLGRVQAVFLLFVFSAAAITLTFIGWRTVTHVRRYLDRSTRYDVIIVRTSLRHGIDPCLVKAVIWRESKFDRSTRGSKGEIGLMQVMPQFAVREWERVNKKKELSAGAISDPECNIEIGTWYLARALRRWNNYKEADALALCEYNAGYQRASAWKPVLPDGSVLDRVDISSTKQYVAEIRKKRQEYQKNWKWKEVLK